MTNEQANRVKRAEWLDEFRAKVEGIPVYPASEDFAGKLYSWVTQNYGGPPKEDPNVQTFIDSPVQLGSVDMSMCLAMVRALQGKKRESKDRLAITYTVERMAQLEREPVDD